MTKNSLREAWTKNSLREACDRLLNDTDPSSIAHSPFGQYADKNLTINQQSFIINNTVHRGDIYCDTLYICCPTTIIGTVSARHIIINAYALPEFIMCRDYNSTSFMAGDRAVVFIVGQLEYQEVYTEYLG